MDQPLFGEARKKSRLATYIVHGILALFVLESFAICLVKSFSYAAVPFMFLATVTLLSCALTFTLVHWWQKGDLDPKFRIFIGLSFLLTFSCCCSCNALAAEHWPEPFDPQCKGPLYNLATQQCWLDGDFAQCGNEAAPNNKACFSVQYRQCWDCVDPPSNCTFPTHAPTMAPTKMMII